MARNKDDFDNEYEFDNDFSVTSVHLDEFRRKRGQFNDGYATDANAHARQGHSGGNYPGGMETAGGPDTGNGLESGLDDGWQNVLENGESGYPDEYPDAGFSDLSERRGYDLADGLYEDELYPGSVPEKKHRTASKFWMVLLLMAVGIGAAILISQYYSKEDDLMPDNDYPYVTPGFDYVSQSDSATVSSAPDETTSTTATDPDEPEYKALKLGDKNDDVKKMQLRLKELGYISDNSCTGYYGNYTQKVIKIFQKKAGLKATGDADTETLKRLYADDAPTYK